MQQKNLFLSAILLLLLGFFSSQEGRTTGFAVSSASLGDSSGTVCSQLLEGDALQDVVTYATYEGGDAGVRERYDLDHDGDVTSADVDIARQCFS